MATLQNYKPKKILQEKTIPISTVIFSYKTESNSLYLKP